MQESDQKYTKMFSFIGSKTVILYIAIHVLRYSLHKLKETNLPWKY